VGEPGVRAAMREARTEAVVVLGIEVALYAGLAFADKAKGWSLVELEWWAWLLLAAPALLLMLLLLAVPRAELSPGRVRNISLGLLGVLVASDAVAVGLLIVALAGSSAASLSAGDLLAHGSVVWLANIITFGLLFWQLDGGGPRVRAEHGRPDPDFEFPQDAPAARRLELAAERLSLRVAHERDRGQPDGHHAADPPGKGPHGRRVADLLRGRDPGHRPCRERAGRLSATALRGRRRCRRVRARSGAC